MKTEEHARSQAEGNLKSIMRMMDRVHHAQTCNGDDCPLTAKEIIEGLGYSCYDGSDDNARLYHDMDAIEVEIFNSPLSVEVRSDWATPGKDLMPMNYRLLMTTGGPAVKITGSLNEEGMPETAELEYQDWGTPWTTYPLNSEELQAILEFAQYFSYQ
jgi:hypothetical protein